MKSITIGFALAGLASLGACQATVASRPGTVSTYEPAPSPRPGPRPEPRPEPRPTTRWTQLADRYSTDSKSQQIILRGQGDFRAIRVEGVRGATVITRLTVDYDDGSAPQVFNLDARLSAGQSKTIDLNGGRRQIKRLIVYTEPSTHGSYSVFGA